MGIGWNYGSEFQGMGQIAEEMGFLVVFLREGHGGDLLGGMHLPHGLHLPCSACMVAADSPVQSVGPAIPMSTLALAG